MANPHPALAPTTGPSIRWGFALAAVVDAGASFALDPVAPGKVRIVATLFATLHVVAIGLSLSAVVAGLGRILPARRGVAPAVALVLAFGAGWGVFVDDFSVFPLGVRAGLTFGAAVPFAALAAVWPWAVRSRIVAAVAGLALVAGSVANHRVLDGSYPGIHLATHTALGLLAALAMEVLRRRITWAPTVRRRWVGHVATGLACVAAATSLVVWPSNAVLITLARMPTAAAVPFLSRLHDDEGTAGLTAVPRNARAWFASREGAAPRPPTSPPLSRAAPLVIFLTIDALRADVVLGEGAGEVAATRTLRALARRGASFTMARSTASSTTPTLSSLFVGKYYSSLDWGLQDHKGKMKYFLADDPSPRFSELLGRAGGVEVSFVPTATGFLTEYGLTRGMEPLQAKVVVGADKAIPQILAWLGKAGPGPQMVWAHLLDPHYPYVQGDRKAPAYERYLAEVAHVDQQIEKLVDAAKAKRHRGRVTFVISADHGEAFGEHGTRTHASTIYEEQVRVPLIIVGPGIVPRTIDEPVSIIDLGATLLDLFGVDTPGTWMGESLVPLLAGRDVQLTRPIVLDAGRRKQGIVFDDGIKAIRNLREKTREAYDLRADPKEAEDLTETRPTVAAERLEAVRAFFDVHERKAPGYEVPYRE